MQNSLHMKFMHVFSSCKCNANIFHLVLLQGAPSDGTDTDHGAVEDHTGV